MDIEQLVFEFRKSGNYDEKRALIRKIAQYFGLEGLKELGDHTRQTPEELARYARLDWFFEDHNRKRRGRKPKKRKNARDSMEEMTELELYSFYRSQTYKPRKRA